jgi:hypothetical protein
VRHSTITLIVALTATFFAGCGSSPSTVNTSQEVAHVKPVSDQKPAKKPAQFNKTAPKSEKYPFEVTSKNDTSEAGKVTITVTNTTNQVAWAARTSTRPLRLRPRTTGRWTPDSRTRWPSSSTSRFLNLAQATQSGRTTQRGPASRQLPGCLTSPISILLLARAPAIAEQVGNIPPSAHHLRGGGYIPI